MGISWVGHRQQAWTLFQQGQRNEDPTTTALSNVVVITIMIAETKRFPEAMGIITGDVAVAAAAALWVEAEEVSMTGVVAVALMTGVVEEDTVVTTMIETEMVVVLTEEAVTEMVEVSTEEVDTTTIEAVSIEVVVEEDMTITMIAVAADLIHFEEVVSTKSQRAIAEVPVA